MAPSLPPELAGLLDGAADPEAGWSEFASRYSRLIIHTARSLTRDRDQAMEMYAFVLGELRADDFKRLRVFRADGSGKFSTWLVIVARRLCVEQLRKRYGRVRSDRPQAKASASLEARRRLADLVGVPLDIGRLPGPASADPEQQLREVELAERLHGALTELEPEDRLLISRRFEDDLSVREITRLMKASSVFHVYRRINAVLRLLRSKLEDQGIEGSSP